MFDHITVDQFINTLMKILNLRDKKTYNHSLRVSRMAVKIADNMNLNQEMILRVRFAAHLHDIGKISIPDGILNKPGRLANSELQKMQTHPQIAYDILHKLPSFFQIAKIILYHHERYDGLGYPDGLLGDIIPLESRIITVADAFDAMLFSRPYRKTLSYEEAYQEINNHINDQFCPLVVESFNQIKLDLFDFLDEVKLSNIDGYDQVLEVAHEMIGHSRKIKD